MIKQSARNKFYTVCAILTLTIVLGYRNLYAQTAPVNSPSGQSSSMEPSASTLSDPSDQGTAIVPSEEKSELDKINTYLNFEDGHYTGSLWYMNQWGQKESFIFHLFVRDRGRFFRILNERQGNVMRILYKPENQEIFTDDMRISEKFHQKAEDRFRNVLGTGLQFMDLAGLSLKSFYKISGRKNAVINKKNLAGIELDAVVKSPVKNAVLFTDPEFEQRPVRMDFYRENRTLYRTMSFHYGSEMGSLDKTGLEGKKYMIKMEVMDLDMKETSGFELESFSPGKPPAALFNSKNIVINERIEQISGHASAYCLKSPERKGAQL